MSKPIAVDYDPFEVVDAVAVDYDPFKEKELEPEFGPIKESYKGLNKQVEAAMPTPTLEVEPEPEYITVYDRGNTGRKVNKAEFLAESQETGDFINEEVKGFVPDVKRILYRTQRNISETILSFTDEDKLNKMSEKEKQNYLNVMTEVTFGNSMLPTNWNDPDVVGKDGRIKPLATVSGEVVNLGSLIYGGGKFAALAKAPSKVVSAFPKISKAASSILGFEASTQLFSDFDNNVFNMVKSVSEDSEYAGKAIVDFMAASEDDTTSEKQLKLLVEGLGFSAVMGVVGKIPKVSGAGITLARQKAFGKRADEMTREELDEATMKYFKAQKVKQSVRGDSVAETEEGLKQILAQNAKGTKLFGESGTGLKQRVKDTLYAADTYINKTKQQMLTSRGYMTPLMFEAATNSKFGQRQLISAAENVANRLNIAINKAENDPKLLKKIKVLMDSDLSSAFKVAPEKRIAFFAKQRNIPEDVAEAVLTARSQIDALSTKILNTKGFSDDAYEAIQANLKTYMRRSYRFFEDAGYKPTDEAKKKALGYMEDVKVNDAVEKRTAKGETTSEKQLESIRVRANKDASFEIDELLGNTDELRDYVSQVKRVGKFYQKNNELSPEIRELLGEIDNPSENIILTISKAARIAEMQDYYNTVKGLGQSKYIFTAGSDATRGKSRYNVTIEGTNSALDGQKTTQEIADALSRREETFKTLEADGIAGASWRFYVGQKGLTQSLKTTYSHATHARNVMGGYQFGLANGRIASHVSGDASDVLKNKVFNKKGRVNKKALDEAYEEYLGLGVINTSVNVNQFREMLETGFRSNTPRVDKLKKSAVGDLVLEKPNEIYMASDDFFKIGAYEAELKTLREAYPEMSENMLKQEAASVVKNTMPNYDLIPKGLKALRNMPFGNFVAFPAEITRTSLNIVKQASKEITSGNAVMAKRGKQRLAGFVTTNSATYGAAHASYSLMGFSDEDVEARRVLLAGPYSDGHSLVYFRLPNGKEGHINLQYLDSYQGNKAFIQTFFQELEDGSLKGEELDKVILKAGIESAKEFLKPYTSQAIATGPLLSITTALLDKDGKDYRGKTIFGAKGANVKELGKLLGLAYLPGSAVTLGKVFEDEDKADEYGNYPQRQMFRNLEQGGIKPVENDLERGFDYKLQDYKILDRQVYLDRLNTKSTPESVADDILLTNSVEFQNQQELYTSVKAGVHTLGAQKVIQKLKGKGFSSERITKILAGNFHPTDLASDPIKQVMDIIDRLQTSQEKIDFIATLNKSQVEAIRITRRLEMLSLEDATGFNVKVQELKEGKTGFATGGEVSTPVPNAPIEPDERINKLTGLPYNEGAGTAYMDQDDPMRRMNMAAGGKATTRVGRPTHQGNFGEGEVTYSERSVTFPIDDAETKWVTFPSVLDKKGTVSSEQEVRDYVIENGPVDPITGEEFPIHDSVEKAEAYAVERSDGLLKKNSGGKVLNQLKRNCK